MKSVGAEAARFCDDFENGFALHDGSSMWDNGAVLYLPDTSAKECLLEFRIDDLR
jgi:hypothetical protein